MGIVLELFIGHCIIMYILIGYHHYFTRQKGLELAIKHSPDHDLDLARKLMPSNILIGIFWPWYDTFTAIKFFCAIPSMYRELNRDDDNKNESE